MLRPYRMLLVVQGSCSILQNDALGSNRDIGCRWVSVTNGSIGSAIFDKVSGSIHGSLRYWHFLVCGGGACMLAKRHGNWIGIKALGVGDWAVFG